MCLVAGLLAPVTSIVGRDGQVGEEDGDGHQARVQVMDEVRHFVEHALPDFSACIPIKHEHVGSALGVQIDQHLAWVVLLIPGQEHPKGELPEPSCQPVMP